MTTIILNSSSKVQKPYDQMSICELAWTIKEDWRKQTKNKVVPVDAKVYVDAMMTMNTINDSYGAESGRGIVLYFLSNAGTWKGEVAKAVKAELKKRANKY